MKSESSEIHGTGIHHRYIHHDDDDDDDDDSYCSISKMMLISHSKSCDLCIPCEGEKYVFFVFCHSLILYFHRKSKLENLPGTGHG